MRGLEKVRGEWALICMTHNLLKLHQDMLRIKRERKTKRRWGVGKDAPEYANQSSGPIISRRATLSDSPMWALSHQGSVSKSQFSDTLLESCSGASKSNGSGTGQGSNAILILTLRAAASPAHANTNLLSFRTIVAGVSFNSRNGRVHKCAAEFLTCTKQTLPGFRVTLPFSLYPLRSELEPTRTWL